MLVAAAGARRVLELGTFTGFTALMMAAALPDGGELITCESDPGRAAFARRFIERSPHGARIRIVVRLAEELVRELEPGFDLVFVDIGGAGATAVYDRCLELLAPRGLLVLDNVLARGKVLDPESKRGRVIHALNQRIAADPRVTQVMLTVRDGLTLVRHKT
jgi:caffeoyl-CoA O-methyltransferase